MSSIDEAWRCVTAALAEKHPHVLARFAPAASPEQFESLESAIGRALPPAVRELYSIANGSRFEDGIFGGWRWLDLDQVLDHYLELAGIEAHCPSGGYPAATSLPLFFHEGDVLYLDASHADSPVYFRDHECPSHQLVAPGLDGFLREHARRVLSGFLVARTHTSSFGNHYDIAPAQLSCWPPDSEAPPPADPAPASTPGVVERIVMRGFARSRRW